MENKTWYNIAVFIKEEVIPELLVQVIHVRLLSVYRNHEDLHYFFCLDSSRGAAIVLYLEYLWEEEEAIVNFYHALVQAVNPTGEFDLKNDSFTKNESGIFTDIPNGQVSYGLFKLKTIPFTHFSANDRDAFFSVLKTISKYLLAQTESDLRLIIKNKFLFSFSLIYKACVRLYALDDRFLTDYSYALNEELDKVSITVGKPIKGGLYNLYVKNRSILDSCTNGIESDNVFSTLFLKSDLSDVIQLLSDKMTQTFNGTSHTLFIQQVFTDICAILNLNNYLTCLFFVQEHINENFKNRRLHPDEELIKK